MTLVAEFTIPSEAVPGGKILEEAPAATIELERVIPTGEAVLPFFWVFDIDADTFRLHIENDPEIARVGVLAEVEYGALFRAKWTPEAEVIEGIKALNATILTAVGTADGWNFRVRAEDRDRLRAFQRIFAEQDIPVQLRRIYSFAEMVEGERPLTPEQRETLIAAYRNGYFEQPGQITQAELGDHFGVTGRAISNRLRRGMRNLIASALLEPTERNDL